MCPAVHFVQLYPSCNISQKNLALVSRNLTKMASLDNSVINFSTSVLLICVAVCIVLYLWTYYNRSVISGIDKKYVLVTGCDSGFGRETAIALDKLGFGVFATCLTREGEESLEAVTSSRLFPLHLDVTDSQRVKAVYERVKELLPPDCGGLFI